MAGCTAIATWSLARRQVNYSDKHRKIQGKAAAADKNTTKPAEIICKAYMDSSTTITREIHRFGARLILLMGLVCLNLTFTDASARAATGKKKPVIIDETKCTKCGACYNICRLGAVEVKWEKEW